MTIGEVASRAQVNIQTVRYYERRGLLSEPRRSAAGYRQYPEAVVPRIRFIKRAQELGFTLEEIGELLALRVRHGEACHEVSDRVKAKVTGALEEGGEHAQADPGRRRRRDRGRGLGTEDITSTFHPYLTLSEAIELAAQTFDRDVAKLSCCAA